MFDERGDSFSTEPASHAGPPEMESLCKANT
jgi:hypothetical protein